MTGKIDFHHHFIPDVYRDALSRYGETSGGAQPPAWSASAALEFLDTHGIAKGLLSISSPGVHLAGGSRFASLARAVNEIAADLHRDHPSRFGSFASVPLPDVDDGLAEIEYAFDTLHADGVVLISNIRGQYLGHRDFDPVWAELNRRKAVVFIHPAQSLPLLDGVIAPIVDYPFDTTRTALNLVYNGVIAKYPDVKIVLSHAGGYLPYVAQRFVDLGSLWVEPVRKPAEILADLKSFYFDTALSASPYALPSLLAFAEPGHVLFGSDYPWAPTEVIESFNDHLDATTLLTDGQRQAIYSESAEKLFSDVAHA